MMEAMSKPLADAGDLVTHAVLAALGVPGDLRVSWASALSAAANLADVRGPRDAAIWLAQIAHESAGLTRLEEGLSYSAERLCQVWPKRFPTLAAARPFARNPRALANKVYNGRMGNREGSDDGWHFRGRGPLQLTGRANFTRFEAWLRAAGIDDPVREKPELLEAPRVGALSAAWFWAQNRVAAIGRSTADLPDAVKSVTRIVNGGAHGLDDRLARTRRAMIAMGLKA